MLENQLSKRKNKVKELVEQNNLVGSEQKNSPDKEVYVNQPTLPIITSCSSTPEVYHKLLVAIMV